MIFGFMPSAVFAAVEVIVSNSQERVVLECRVGTFTNLAWKHNDQLIQSLNNRNLPRKGTPKTAILGRSKCVLDRLEIPSVMAQDTGTFTCIADGKTKEFKLLVVSVGSSPPELHSGSKATLQCVVNTGKPLSPKPTVQWIRPDGVPHPAKGPAHLYPVTASDSGVWVCSFLYEGRTYNSSLHVRVKGAVQQLCRVFDFCGPGEEPGPAQFHWWLWVAIGAGSFLVLLMLVCISVLIRRNRRRKVKVRGQSSHLRCSWTSCSVFS
uniref:Ig-like domain-containing protein n=1 Tax=Cynoglossus semilaevis TaxID=244447 RepID=A0A3P8WVR9_CYNSE